MTPRCPKCFRYLAKVTAWGNGDRIICVQGICKKHGLVDTDDWDADMFEYD
jgi:hypothetical protein